MARGRLNSGSKAEAELPKAKINRSSLRNVAKLLTYLKPYRVKFIAGLVFLFLSSLVGLAFPAILGALIDAAQGIYKYKYLPHGLNAIAIMGFIILFAQAFVSFFRVVWFVQVAEKSLADIRRDTYFKLITLPMNFFANRRVGELNSRISADLSQIQDTLTTTFAEMIRQLVIMIGSTTLLAIVSIKLTLALLAILPFLVAFAVFFGRFIRKLSREAQDKLAESNTIVEETLQGIANVKAFVNEAYEANRYDKILRKVVNIAVRGAKFRGTFASFIVFCLFGTFVGVIWYGSVLVANHEIYVGDLTTFIMYSIFVGAAMGSFPDLYANLQKAVGASERVLEILAEQGEEISIVESDNNIKQPIKGDLAFDNVLFAYPSRPEITVLKGISFNADAGQRVAIVGPSGSGKSTMASLILQFYHPQSGSILFDGKPAHNYSLTDIRNQVAIVPQDVLLFGGTIMENIAYGRLNASKEDIIQAAKRANAHQFISSFPEGYETVVGERGVKLSGGQRQRIAIARALLKNPSILILDEATSSLDSESERLVQEALEELMKDRTSIIIAHRLSTIREADKIIVLEKGHIVESGSHVELIGNEQGLYKYLSQLQFESNQA
ncbi:ATP-binding cassette domain-containing protein [Mucilaginibacter rubeus]|uniref:ATP-binding cassette domain-containing protein n=1 Tax=Mucilaginibacter rubeus TaxID=2027860 RepID=A0AAE6JEI7_9SPHI|nr:MULTISPECIES: ABC transporter transmembrane domain-containing protein [Mucilaginibacter]QEM03347.1 ATP-binding cassette domain-containing protein [Mucilaginibacter rubeus]QEM15965.1 ATP-binding cassette domain-containing protein [Mucilaginibacter gossypii]QTE41290.1 ATP-binding cassette domain-containing protein [Mucilaginibacter rubeus]QTE47894.1 ATP-binding cassette domain-containing protein [Mucilaginibacter rubeus]QTE59287.1 ATP-binding cassette domain-containing protein [Mucilaginibact